MKLIVDIRHSCKLLLYAIQVKHDPNSRKWQNTSFCAWFRPIKPKFAPPKYFLKNLAWRVARYHGQVSTCQKTNGSILRTFSDGRTDRRTDRLTEEQEWFYKVPEWRQVLNILMEKLLFSEMSFVWATSNLIDINSL